MKTRIEIAGCFPSLRALDRQQYINAIEPRLIDIRSPATGLQIDLFGRVTDVVIRGEAELVTIEIEVPDAFLQRHNVSPGQLDEVLAARISKLRHPSTGAMTPVRSRVIANSVQGSDAAQ